MVILTSLLKNFPVVFHCSPAKTFIGVQSCLWPGHLSSLSVPRPCESWQQPSSNYPGCLTRALKPVSFASNAFLLYLLLNTKSYPSFKAHSEHHLPWTEVTAFFSDLLALSLCGICHNLSC